MSPRQSIRGLRRKILTVSTLLTPAAIVMMPFLAIVVIGGLKLSLYGENLLRPTTANHFVGFANFARAFTDPTLGQSVLITVIYVTLGVLVEVLVGIAIALLMRLHFPAKGIIRALILVPMVITPVVAGLTWRLLLDPTAGTINWLLGVIGLGSDHAFLSNPNTALLALIAVEIWQNTPYVIIIVLAGLESLDPSPLEAAQIDGANRFQTIRHVIIPMLRPVIAIVILLRVIDAVKTFALVQTMTKGGPGTSTLAISPYVYRTGFELFDIGYSSALGLITSIALVVIIFPFARRLMGLTNGRG